VNSFRFTVDIQPEKHTAENLVAALAKETSVENLKILVVRPEGGRDVVSDQLSKLGAIVDEAIAYRTVPETEANAAGIARFQKDGADLVTFTSGSTAENFQKLGLPVSSSTKFASIGPVTSAAMRQLGMRVDLEAETHDIPGLVAAIEKFFQREKTPKPSGG
jgi:uroporphyrinogen III methyltransferase/synthase